MDLLGEAPPARPAPAAVPDLLDDALTPAPEQSIDLLASPTEPAPVTGAGYPITQPPATSVDLFSRAAAAPQSAVQPIGPSVDLLADNAAPVAGAPLVSAAPPPADDIFSAPPPASSAPRPADDIFSAPPAPAAAELGTNLDLIGGT